jgi:hypothetical protein
MRTRGGNGDWDFCGLLVNFGVFGLSSGRIYKGEKSLHETFRL